MAFQTAIEAAMTNMKQAMSPPASAKAARQDVKQTAGGGRRNASPEDGENQFSAIQQGVKAAFTVFGQVVEETMQAQATKLEAATAALEQKTKVEIQSVHGRLAVHEDKLTALNEYRQQLEKTQKELQQAADAGTVAVVADEATKQQVAALEATVAELTAKLDKVQIDQQKTSRESQGSAPRASQSNASTALSDSGDIPFEMRTNALIGSLAPHDDPQPIEFLEEQAQHILRTAGIPSEWILVQPVAVVRKQHDGSRKGTGAELIFHKPEQLSAAKLKVRAAKQLNSRRSLIWLDARKTRAETLPSRATHKIYEYLQYFRGKTPFPGELSKDVTKRTITLDGAPFATLRGRRFVWSPVALRIVPQSDREDMQESALHE